MKLESADFYERKVKMEQKKIKENQQRRMKKIFRLLDGMNFFADKKYSELESNSKNQCVFVPEDSDYKENNFV